jgi:hypothetical protein
VKSQGVRLLDVLFLGPFMMYFGFKAKGLSRTAKDVMVFSGAATIFYNLNNWLDIRRAA